LAPVLPRGTGKIPSTVSNRVLIVSVFLPR
jgi:hypothetical protein